MSSGCSVTKGKWITENSTVYLQDRSNASHTPHQCIWSHQQTAVHKKVFMHQLPSFIEKKTNPEEIYMKKQFDLLCCTWQMNSHQSVEHHLPLEPTNIAILVIKNLATEQPRHNLPKILPKPYPMVKLQIIFPGWICKWKPLPSNLQIQFFSIIKYHSQ